MTYPELTAHRLTNQHLTTGEKLASQQSLTPGEVVASLGAVQAQDYLGSLWAIGLRAPGTTQADIEQAISAKAFVRTHPMRGTFHFVAPADIRWMLTLLTPRVSANIRRRVQSAFAIDAKTIKQSWKVFEKALRGGKQLTRDQMYAALENAGITANQQRGLHLLGLAEGEGLICYGPRHGKQPTFVLLEEYLPAVPPLSREQSLAAIARRYFTSHGPATLQDFTWWTGLAAADARAALESVRSEFAALDHDGKTYYHPRESAPHPAALDTAYLLPAYDEYVVGYQDRRAFFDEKFASPDPRANIVFNPTVVVGGQIVGTWRRSLKRRAVTVTTTHFRSLNQKDTRAVTAAVEKYGAFLNLRAQWVSNQP